MSNLAARRLDECGVLGRDRRLVLRGSLARAITCRFSSLSRVEEFDVLWFRVARGAARAQIDPSRPDGIDELIVGRSVASQNSRPPRIVHNCRRILPYLDLWPARSSHGCLNA